MGEFRPSIFVSATTRDLGSYRALVRDELLTAKLTPVVQEHFPSDYRSLTEFLELQLRPCDAVVCLVGPSYGAAPEHSGERSRSYTQIEYDIARRLKKRVFVYCAAPNCRLDQPPCDGDKESKLQEEYIARLHQEHKCTPFSSDGELRDHILRLVPLLSRAKLPPRFVHPAKEPAFFAGRDYELCQLSDAVARRSPCLVAVIGIGGQGKTTLVSQWLRIHGHEGFAAVFWCTAYRGGFTFDMFLDETLKYLLVGEFAKPDMPDVSARSRALLTLLQDRPTLVVVDGIERWLTGWNRGKHDMDRAETAEERKGHYEGLDEFLGQISGISSGSHLVFTTRALPAVLDDLACAIIPVDKDGKTMKLQGLDDDASCHLLTEMGVRGEREQLLAAARLYLNHPLALTVLGGLLVKKYGGRIERLPEVSALDPQRRLFELLEETRQNLPGSTTAERFLQVASHCLENPSLDVVAAVMAATSGATKWRILRQILARLRRRTQDNAPAAADSFRDLAITLADWHLMDWDAQKGIIRLHPLIKAHFAGLAADSTSIHRELARWYSEQSVDEHAAEVGQVRPRLLAIEHSLRACDIQHCAQLMFGPLTSRCTFSEWMGAWGHQSMGIELLGRLAEQATGNTKGVFLVARAAMHHQLDRAQLAADDLDEAIRIFETERGPTDPNRVTNLARALASRANIHRETGRSSEAVRGYDRAIAVAESVPAAQRGEDTDVAQTLVNRALALWDQGHWGRALSDYDRAVSLLRRGAAEDSNVDDRLLVFALCNRGVVLSDAGAEPRALRDFEEAVDICKRAIASGRSELQPRLAQLQTLRSCSLRESGRVAEALAECERAIATLSELVEAGRKDEERSLALAWMNQAKTLLATERTADALANSGKSVLAYERLVAEGRPHLAGSLAHALLVRGECRSKSGDHTGGAGDRDRGLATMRLLMRDWWGESDIGTVFLQETAGAVGYLWPHDPKEAGNLLGELVDVLERILSAPDAPEGHRLAAERVLKTLQRLAPALQAGGIDVSRMGRLTERAGPGHSNQGGQQN